MKQNETILVPKSSKKFQCESCSFECSRKSQFERHISTRKHQFETKVKQNETSLQGGNGPGTFLVPVEGCKDQTPNDAFLASKSSDLDHECEYCALSFKSRTTLWRHRKVCLKKQGNNQIINGNNVGDVIDKDVLIKMLLKNQDVMEKMVTNLGNTNSNNNSHNNLNSHNNNTFNIQMFLNEHCKNAMNLTDFINSLPITNETYNHTIENGLTKTITNMITDGLSNMDILERPIHCTDSNRKTIYVKDDDVWEQDKELLKILNGIKTVALKQRTMIDKWKEANEGWKENENLQNQLTSLVFNSMTLIEQDEKEMNKIVRAISKNTYLTSDIKNEYK
jgi:hypothetical protein